jgi:Protein of unknown function (DUF2949)
MMVRFTETFDNSQLSLLWWGDRSRQARLKWLGKLRISDEDHPSFAPPHTKPAPTHRYNSLSKSPCNVSKIMKSKLDPQLIDFLQQELSVSPEAIALVLRQKPASAQLPIMLWQYGLITLQQLDKIFDWREQVY